MTQHNAKLVTPETNSLLLRFTMRLNYTSARLLSAYNGVDVNWVDDSGM